MLVLRTLDRVCLGVSPGRACTTTVEGGVRLLAHHLLTLFLLFPV